MSDTVTDEDMRQIAEDWAQFLLSRELPARFSGELETMGHPAAEIERLADGSVKITATVKFLARLPE